MQQSSEKERKVRVIETSIKKQDRHVKVVRGERSQTKELNIHCKTITNKFIVSCILSNELNVQDREVYEEYKKKKPNFESTEFLFTSLSPEMKSKSLGFYQSSKVVKELLLSERMFVENKIVMVKFLQKIAFGVHQPIRSWKEIYFKNKK